MTGQKDVMQDAEKQPTGKFSYLQDNELYMLWKYLNGRRFSRLDTLDFEDITPSQWDVDTAAMRFVQLIDSLQLEIEGLTFEASDYMQFQNETGHAEISSIKNGSKMSEAIGRIVNGKWSYQDVVQGSLLFRKAGITPYFKFSNRLSEETAGQLGRFIDTYTDDFINDNLQIDNRNFYKFEKQKESFFRGLTTQEEKYGNQFIIRYPKEHTRVVGMYDIDPDFLFVHSLVALEKLGYYTVQQIWLTDFHVPPNAQTEDFKIKLVLADKFYAETKPKKELPRELTFDPSTSVLDFKGRRIDISKTKDSDPHYLLGLIFKDKGKEWGYDELWEDDYFRSHKGFYDPQKDWRKIYNAAYSVNEKVAKATAIQDFLTISKTALSITKKYR